jgi:hypothetical protein
MMIVSMYVHPDTLPEAFTLFARGVGIRVIQVPELVVLRLRRTIPDLTRQAVERIRVLPVPGVPIVRVRRGRRRVTRRDYNVLLRPVAAGVPRELVGSRVVHVLILVVVRVRRRGRNRT